MGDPPNPYPYPRKTRTRNTGTGFHGYGLGSLLNDPGVTRDDPYSLLHPPLALSLFVCDVAYKWGCKEGEEACKLCICMPPPVHTPAMSVVIGRG